MRKLISIYAIMVCILMLGGCTNNVTDDETQAKENMFSEELCSEMTEFRYLNFDETQYSITEEDDLNTVKEMLLQIHGVECDNPEIAGWYSFVIYTRDGNNLRFTATKDDYIGRESVIYYVDKTFEVELKKFCMENGKALDVNGKPIFQKDIMEDYIKMLDELGAVKAFLYDITGDGFPELLEVVPIFYGGDYFIDISDFSGEEPQIIGQISFNEGEKIYVCKDENNQTCIISFETSYGMAGIESVSYSKSYIYEHNIISDVLGSCSNYYTGDGDFADYNGYLYFNGEVIEPLGDCDIKAEDILKGYFDEYLKSVEIIAEYTVPELADMDAAIEEFVKKQGEYTYEPGYDYEEWNSKYQEKLDENGVDICGTSYNINSKHIWIARENIDETFDSDILNQFPNLQSVTFTAEYGDAAEHKIQIKPSEWCSRITSLQFNGEQFEPVGDYSVFDNIQELTIDGDIKKIGNADYIKNFSQVNILNLFIYSDTKEFLEIIEMVSELPAIKVVTYSGHNFWFKDGTEEEINRIYELLSDKVFACIK